VIPAHADMLSSVELGTSLSDNDLPWEHIFVYLNRSAVYPTHNDDR
jgi:hypothetical protein